MKGLKTMARNNISQKPKKLNNLSFKKPKYGTLFDQKVLSFENLNQGNEVEFIRTCTNDKGQSVEPLRQFQAVDMKLPGNRNPLLLLLCYGSGKPP